MRGQWAIFQAARNIEPCHTIRMQREGPGSAQCGDSLSIAEIAGIGGRDGFFKVGNVESAPVFLLFVPPDKLLAVAPRLAIRTRRSAVVDDAAIIRPGKAPSVAEQVFG